MINKKEKYMVENAHTQIKINKQTKHTKKKTKTRTRTHETCLKTSLHIYRIRQ